jgi:hypothetical protein
MKGHLKTDVMYGGGGPRMANNTNMDDSGLDIDFGSTLDAHLDDQQLGGLQQILWSEEQLLSPQQYQQMVELQRKQFNRHKQQTIEKSDERMQMTVNIRKAIERDQQLHLSTNGIGQRERNLHQKGRLQRDRIPSFERHGYEMATLHLRSDLQLADRAADAIDKGALQTVRVLNAELRRRM